MDSFNPFSLEGKTILVTGASSGIGRAVAIACARMGATVVLNGRNRERLAATAAEIGSDRTVIAAGDLTDSEQLQQMMADTPTLDGVVHCAGIWHNALCKQITAADVDSVMGVNFRAPVLLQTELLKQKRLNKGASIVFITSIASESPAVGNAVYSASKGALVSYANCLMKELAPRRIRVNCISPAMVWTDLVYHGGVTEEELREDEQTYPLKRYGTPDDVAHLAVYMLSDAASWMTGSVVKITGGFR